MCKISVTYDIYMYTVQYVSHCSALHDEIELARRLDDLVELDDVSAAPDELQNMNLASKRAIKPAFSTSFPHRKGLKSSSEG